MRIKFLSQMAINLFSYYFAVAVETRDFAAVIT